MISSRAFKVYLKVGGKYGLLGGVLCIVFFWVLFFINYNPFFYKLAFDFILIPIMVYFCIREYRDIWNGGQMSFGEGMTLGLINYITVALISSVFIAIYLSIDGTLLQEFIGQKVQAMVEKKDRLIELSGKTYYQNTLADLRQDTLWDLVLDDLLRKVSLGLFWTIIIAVASKRKIVNIHEQQA